MSTAMHFVCENFSNRGLPILSYKIVFIAAYKSEFKVSIIFVLALSDFKSSEK